MLKHCPSLVKYCITVMACSMLLPAKAQLYMYACKNAGVTFIAPAPVAPETGGVTWYDDANAGNVVGTGQSFTTPALTAGRSYYYTYGDGLLRREARVFVTGSNYYGFSSTPYGCINQNVMVSADNNLGSVLACNGSRGAFTIGSVPLPVTVYISLQALVYWNGGNGQNQYIMYNGYSGAGYGVYVNGAGKLIIRVTNVDVPTDATLETNKWAHIAVVHSVDHRWILYYNGKAYTPQNDQAGSANPHGGFYIGNNEKSNWFNGLIDNVAVWNKPLTPYEVGFYRNINKGADGLAGLWTFDETDGGTAAHDASGGNFDVTLSSADTRGYFDAGFIWSMDGAPATGVFPKYVFNTTGNKTITLVSVTGKDGCPAATAPDDGNINPAYNNVSKTINVNAEVPPPVIVTSAADTVCPNDGVLVSVSGGGILVNGDFDYKNIDGGWKNVNSFYSGTSFAGAADGSPYAEMFLYTNNSGDSYILSPAFSTIGKTGMQVVLEHHLSNAGNYASIQMSVDSVSWTNIVTLPANVSDANTFEIDYYAVPASFENKSKVYLRLFFKWTGTPNDGYRDWKIGRAAVITTRLLPDYRWTSNPAGYTDVKTPHYVNPAVTTTYTAVSYTGCSSTSSSKTIYARPLPTATMAVQGSNAFCLGSTQPAILFTGSGGTVRQGHYYFNYLADGYAKTANSVGNIGRADTLQQPPGTYTYRLTSVRDDYCSVNLDTTLAIKINPLPTATISIQPFACVGDAALHYTLTGSGGKAPYIYRVNQVTDLFARTITGKADGLPSTGDNASSTAPITEKYVLQNVTDANGCSRPKADTVIMVINPKPNVTISSSAGVFCGDTLTLTASGAASYAWGDSVIGSGPKVKAVPSATAVYSVNGTNLGCATVAAGITIPYQALKLAPTTQVSVCNGSTATLSATAYNLAYTAFRETFDAPLTGWEFLNNDTGPRKDSSGWNPVVSGLNSIGVTTPDGSGFYSPEVFYNNRTASPPSPNGFSATIISPAFSTVGVSNLTLTFNQYYNLVAPALELVSGIVAMSADKTHWTFLYVVNNSTNGGTSNSFITSSFAIPAQFENQATVYISFSLTNQSTNYTSFWAINHVQVTGKKNVPSTAYTWASVRPVLHHQVKTRW